MTTALKFRRGTTTQHSSFTGAAGEITVDTTKNTAVVHDGSTAGGFALAKAADVNPPTGTAILKANNGAGFANAVAGTDYIAPPSGTALLKANSGGALANATAGTDYLAPPSGTALLKANSGGALANASAGTDYVAPATNTTFTVAQRGAVSALTDGATITPDFAASNNFSVTLGGNRTLANPTNLVAGQSGSIFIAQDGTGSRTLAYGSYYDFIGGTAPTLTTTASAVDRIDYIVRSSTSIHCVFTGNYS